MGPPKRTPLAGGYTPGPVIPAEAADLEILSQVIPDDLHIC